MTPAAQLFKLPADRKTAAEMFRSDLAAAGSAHRDDSGRVADVNVVADRIKTILDGATAEAEGTQRLNLTERLEAAYDEAKRLVDELSGLSDGG